MDEQRGHDLGEPGHLNGDFVTIASPQIVNGLQTSTQIAKHFQPEANDNRNDLIWF